MAYLEDLFANYKPPQAIAANGYTAPAFMMQPQVTQKKPTASEATAQWIDQFGGDLAPLRAQQYKDATETKSNKGFLGNMSERDRFLLDLGLGMMMSASKPGATFAGALGEGGKYAADSDKSRMEYADTQAEKGRKAKNDVLNQLGLDYGNKQNMDFRNKEFGFLLDKFDYSKGQDSIQNQLRQNELGLRAAGLDLDRQKLDYTMSLPDTQVFQDKDGGYYTLDKKTGATSPIYGAGGQQIMGGVEAQSNPLFKPLADIYGNENFMDDNARNDAAMGFLKFINNMNSGGMGGSAVGGATPKIAQPKSKADYDSLPSGSRFVDPSGQIRVKP